MTATTKESPLSPATWLRAARVAPRPESAGYGRMLAAALGLFILSALMPSSFETGGFAFAEHLVLPLVTLAFARWAAPARDPVGSNARPDARVVAAFAVIASVALTTPLVAGASRAEVMSVVRPSVSPSSGFLVAIVASLWLLVPAFALGLRMVPSFAHRLLSYAWRPVLVAALAAGALLVAGGAASRLRHPDVAGYVGRLVRVPLVGAPNPSDEAAVQVGRCRVWVRQHMVSVDPPRGRGAAVRREWLYPSPAMPVDRVRGAAFVPDPWKPRAVDLVTCRTFEPTSGYLTADIAPPTAWIVVALLGLVAAGLTLARARTHRRALGDPGAWRDATLTPDGELVLEGETSARAHSFDPSHAGPVVLLRSVPPARSGYRDAPIVGPDGYVVGDRAALRGAVDDARLVAEVEALAYVVAACAPLGACAMVGLF